MSSPHLFLKNPCGSGVDSRVGGRAERQWGVQVVAGVWMAPASSAARPRGTWGGTGLGAVPGGGAGVFCSAPPPRGCRSLVLLATMSAAQAAGAQ